MEKNVRRRSTPLLAFAGMIACALLFSACSSKPATPDELLRAALKNTEQEANKSGVTVMIHFPGDPDAHMKIDKTGNFASKSEYGDWVVIGDKSYTNDIVTLDEDQREAAAALGYDETTFYMTKNELLAKTGGERLMSMIAPFLAVIGDAKKLRYMNDTFTFTATLADTPMAFRVETEQGMLTEVVGVSTVKTQAVDIRYTIDMGAPAAAAPANVADVATFERNPEYFAKHAKKLTSEQLAFLTWFAVHTNEATDRAPTSDELSAAVDGNVYEQNVKVTVVGDQLQGVYTSPVTGDKVTYCAKFHPGGQNVDVVEGACSQQ